MVKYWRFLHKVYMYLCISKSGMLYITKKKKKKKNDILATPPFSETMSHGVVIKNGERQGQKY